MSKTINITWTQPTIGSPINDYTLEYGVSGQALTNVNTGSSSPSYQLDDLTDNEIYQLRIAGINSEGTGDYTSVVYHYASQYPSAPLILASGEPANSGDLLLTWNTPQFSETSITDYDISYTPDGDSTTTVNSTNTSYDLTNLNCSKNHNISIKANNSSGEGPAIVGDFVPYCGVPPTTPPPSTSDPASISFTAGTGGGLRIANTPAVQMTGSMTLEGWVYVDPSNTIGFNGYMFNKYVTTGTRAGYRMSYYWSPDDSSINMRLYTGTGFNQSTLTQIPSADRPTAGSWNHYAAVIDVALSEHRLYLNGVLIATTVPSSSVNDSTLDLYIGSQTDTGANTQRQAFFRITRAVRYSADFTPSYDINDYLDGNDPMFSDVALLILGSDKNTGDTTIVDESSTPLPIVNLGTGAYDAVYVPPNVPPSFFNIVMEDDGTSGFDLQVDISMDDLPAGATGYKIAFDGTLGEGGGTSFTGALLYIQSPSVGPIYSTNDGPPSTAGTAADNFRAFWRSGTIPPTSGYGGRDAVFITTQAGSEFDGTVTIQPVDASNNPVGPNSNIISVFIFEDG